MNGKIFIKRGTKVIGKAAYEDQFDITEITIPEGVRIIGDYAFNRCLSIREINLPKRSLKRISDMCFTSTGIESLTIPDCVESIGRLAFGFNPFLRTIHIGKNVRVIESGAFAGCPDLTKITVDPENPYFYVENGCLAESESKKLIAATYPYEVPEGIEIIGHQAFVLLTNCECVTLPKSVRQIDMQEGELSNFKVCFKFDTDSLQRTERSFTLRAPIGSYAESFARSHNIKFEEI